MISAEVATGVDPRLVLGPLSRGRGDPCLRVEGLVVWGLTYRMFDDLRVALEVP